MHYIRAKEQTGGKKVKIVVFDLDGVLVDIDSSWGMIHKAFGVDNQVNFQKHLKDQIDFKEFMRSDIRLWNRPYVDKIKNILNKAPLMKGAIETVKELKKNGYKIAIISSGISILADRVKEELGIDYSYSNKLLVGDDGRLTGEGEGAVSLMKKHVVLKKMSEVEGIDSKQCVTIGDSKYDIPLFMDSGLSIAFNPKDDLIRGAADLVVEGTDLRKILPWLLNRKKIIKAEFYFNYSSGKKAKSIVRAIAPDNLTTPFGLIIKARRDLRRVAVKIVTIRKVETLLSTI
ncbi:HAD-IB family phosphatase, partial [Candidatus Bathyarchaeota archaeon]|nr:HAD-IB family phosphatase [Candidatus Bathyarchaeota archaeon]